MMERYKLIKIDKFVSSHHFQNDFYKVIRKVILILTFELYVSLVYRGFFQNTKYFDRITLQLESSTQFSVSAGMFLFHICVMY